MPEPGRAWQAPANGPVVVLTYGFSGWQRLQDVLERVPELACTAGTGVLGMCDMAARAWANVDRSGGEHLSSLAVNVHQGNGDQHDDRHGDPKQRGTPVV